jgi:hypothetical protein
MAVKRSKLEFNNLNAKSRYLAIGIMLSVVLLSIIMLSVIVLNVLY